MPDNKIGPFNRRAVLAGAAAALSAVPLAAKAENGGSKIVVDLGGVMLPDKIADELERDIRRAVLMAVARAMPHTKFRAGTLPKGARGIVLVPMSAL